VGITSISESYIEDLCEKYNIDMQTAIDCINNAIQSYSKNTALAISKNDGNIDMSVFRLFDFKKVDLTAFDKERIHKISKLLRYYLNLAKYKSLYNNYKYLIGKLVYGNITLKTHEGYFVDLDRNYIFNIPAGIKSLYPLQFQPVPERGTYDGGDYMVFTINGIRRIAYGDIEFILSRTTIQLPELIIKDELKINGVKTVLRIPGTITRLKTELNIPQKTIDHVKELLRGENIYVFKERQEKR